MKAETEVPFWDYRDSPYTQRIIMNRILSYTMCSENNRNQYDQIFRTAGRYHMSFTYIL